jgi:excisionase family DNA binding protein
MFCGVCFFGGYMQGEQLETVDQLAERWQVTRGWIYDRTCQSGKGGGLPFIKLGKYVRFKTAEVDAWLEMQRAKAALLQEVSCAPE